MRHWTTGHGDWNGLTATHPHSHMSKERLRIKTTRWVITRDRERDCGKDTYLVYQTAIKRYPQKKSETIIAEQK